MTYTFPFHSIKFDFIREEKLENPKFPRYTCFSETKILIKILSNQAGHNFQRRNLNSIYIFFFYTYRWVDPESHCMSQAQRIISFLHKIYIFRNRGTWAGSFFSYFTNAISRMPKILQRYFLILTKIFDALYWHISNITRYLLSTSL